MAGTNAQGRLALPEPASQCREASCLNFSLNYFCSVERMGQSQMADHPLAGRLAMFREMAAEARKDAARATSADMKLGYERLVESWDQLISEIEAAIESEKMRPKQVAR
jgi:hypothetical protein